jgi:diguanylate cyclase (GGDEF)-like protein
MPRVNDPAGTPAHSSGDARQRASIVRMIAQIVSAEAPVADLWSRCAIPVALLVDGDRTSVALRTADGDRLVFASTDDETLPVEQPPVEPGSVAAEVLASGETVVREVTSGADVGVPVRFGRQLLGAIVVESVPNEALEHVPLLESCALYVAARIDHANTLERTERYARLALIDSLTGVANRRKFDEMLPYEWARAAREGTPIALAILDLDFFKQFNDSYGHQAGDLCLQQVAQALGEGLRRPTDLLARYGGEEFVALLPTTDLAGATALAEAMRDSLTRLGITHASTSLGRVTLSAGVASAIPKPGSSPDELVRVADAALYEAKQAGRNRVVAQGYISEAPTTVGVGNVPPTNLPIALSRLVGRRAEIADVRDLLEGSRLVTVLGFGGTGKTRVALQVANELTERYPDGVWLVDLATLTDGTLVAATIGGVFGASIPTDGTAIDSLVHALHAKRALLVVDNCEHLVAAAAVAIAALLRGCPSLSILTTSREPLDLGGETIYRLPLLSLPARPADLAAEEAIRADAVALFVERARAANRRFALTDENAPLVAELVHRLDGIALAIELAAARLSAIGLEALSERLDERFRILTGGDRAALPRQQTMRATIDWSHDLLSETEQVLFRRLAVFAGTFSSDAVAAVCSDDELVPAGETFDALIGLVQKSLVTAETEGVEDRYLLLESMRHYARERLVQAAEYDVRADRQAAYALQLAMELDARYHTTPSRAWYAAAEQHVPNFRAALDWTLGTRTDVVCGARMVGALASFFSDFSAAEGVRWLLQALAALPPDSEPRVEALLWARLARANTIVPAIQLRDAAERALAIYRTLDEPAGLANALRTLAQVLGWYFRDERELADALACESIEIARSIGDPALIADCLKTRGLTIGLSEVAAKRAVLEESLALFRMFGNDRQIASALTWISDFEFSVGEKHRALDYGRDAMRYARATGAPGIQDLAAGNLAAYAVNAGDWDTGRRAALESLQIASATRSRAGFTWAVQALAFVSAGTGDAHRAAQLLGFCDARAGTVHVPRQADQCEDITYRRLLPLLEAALGPAELGREMGIGALLDEEAAMREALAV